ncbi:carbohydrate binding family 6 [Purpureocillium lavendulum]|uniref:Carbohydrate binding family 6 n=1 Tax=Purpureocillium lavendulum TaxID=1247861 RepID=A0AB34FTT4_9HYPO|nr:carbohydrate binding family 6 [Purpureocillium lavendulum]
MFRYAAAIVVLLHQTLTLAAPWVSFSGSVSVSSRKWLFYDDFSQQAAGSPPDRRLWTIDLGHSYPGGPENWGTGELQTYTANRTNIAITTDGTLKITPMRGSNGTWTSSRIETTADWDMKCYEGQRMRVEARIKLGANSKAESLGIWQAFWALGSDFRGNFSDWPAVSEVDILESVNGETKLWKVAHCGVNPGGPCNEPSGISNITEGLTRGAWHTVAWEVDRRARPFSGEESMSWFMDGQRRWTLTASQMNDTKAWQTLVGGKKMLLLNVAVGGGFPDAIAKTKTPTNATRGGDGASMEVDYVRAYASWW